LFSYYHKFQKLNSEYTVEICQRYHPLKTLFRPYIRIANIIVILDILRPYITLTFSAQNPDGKVGRSEKLKLTFVARGNLIEGNEGENES
jgi:hypothetical protein